MHLEMGDAKERSPSRPMKCYRNYLINCRDLLNVQLDSTGKHHMGDLNCDLLSETISKSKHLVRLIHITHAEYHGLTQVIKEATRTTAETNTLTYYIVTNKRTILLTVVLFLVALVIISPKT